MQVETCMMSGVRRAINLPEDGATTGGAFRGWGSSLGPSVDLCYVSQDPQGGEGGRGSLQE